MAIQCKYCGTNLPKDDARFCNNCGMLVPSHPFSPQSLAALKNDSKYPFLSTSDEQQEVRKPILREQVAEFSPVRSTPDYSKQEVLADKAQAQDTPDASASNELAQGVEVLETASQNVPETPQPDLQSEPVVPPADAASKSRSPIITPRPGSGGRSPAPGSRHMTPRPPTRFAPVAYTTVKEDSTPEKQASDEPEDVSSMPISPDDMSVSRLHVKVWRPEDQNGPVDSKAPAIEEMPTRAMEVPIEDVPTQSVGTGQSMDTSIEDVSTRALESPIEDVPTQSVDTDIEDMPTRAIAAMPSGNRYSAAEKPVEDLPRPFLSVPPTQSTSQETLTDDWRVQASSTPSPAIPFVPVPVRASTSPFVSSSEYQSGDISGDVPLQKEVTHSSLPKRGSRRRGPIIFVVLLLVVLILGGLGSAVVLSQHAGVDPVTQPQVSFSDTHLGLSLQYPNGWTEQVDTAKSTLHLAASGHIGQIDIVVSAGSGDVKQALQQQATKMGLSGTKAAASLNFAGATWQQLQGTLQQSGVNYTDTIAVVLHGGQLFMMVQQAPQNNYADWEKEFFLPLRQSFKFL